MKQQQPEHIKMKPLDKKRIAKVRRKLRAIIRNRRLPAGAVPVEPGGEYWRVPF